MTATFYLGTHQPGWLRDLGVPLFVADQRLRGYRRLPEAAAPWALDSGGFSELQRHGRWTVDPRDYVRRVRRYRDEIGRLAWAAPQDWMCEPIIITGGRLGHVEFAGTRLDVAEHQRRTVDNYLLLRDLGPDLPIRPVVQGYVLGDYLACRDRYARQGVDLTAEPLVGLGSVCRRQSTSEIHGIVTALHAEGLTRLHGFGVKTRGLARYGPYLASADSLAWSYSGRRVRPGCTPSHRSEGNCARYALAWRRRVVDVLSGPTQLDLFGGAT